MVARRTPDAAGRGFAYVAPDGQRWNAPAGAIIDGASIPRFAWTYVGGPFEGRYRDASVIHDVACELKARPWQAVHLAFFHAMRARQVPALKAKQMYAAVYHFGPRWSRTVTKSVAIGEVDAQERRLRAQALAGEHVDISRTEVGGVSSCDPETPEAQCEQGDTRIANLTATYAPLPARTEGEFPVPYEAIETQDLTLEQIRTFWSASAQ